MPSWQYLAHISPAGARDLAPSEADKLDAVKPLIQHLLAANDDINF